MAYQYNNLEPQVGSIRLITIQPSLGRTAPVDCTIAHAGLESAQYSALSYTWGSPENKQDISLNGKPFWVTQNLFSALKDLRHTTESLTLWIDAICINQEDIDERTQQVKEMTSIYRKATRVYVWMGEAIENLDAAISLLNWLKACMNSGDLRIGRLVGLIESNHRMEGWEALTELLRRPWWSRVWILQEVVFGKELTVVCGEERFEWELLQSLGESRQLLDKITWSMLNLDKTFYSGQFVHVSDRLDFICALKKGYPLGRQALKTVLCGVRASEATDPRDKVFAILGLFDDTVKLCDIDYRKTVNQVYVEAAAGLLKQMDSIHWLSWTHNTLNRDGYTSRPLDLASWAPSWIASQGSLLELQLHDDYTNRDDRAVPDQEIEKEAALASSKTTFQIDLSNRAFYINTKSTSSWTALLFGSGAQIKKSIYSATQGSRHFATCNTQEGSLTVLGFAIDVLEDVSPPTSNGPFFPTDGPASRWIRILLNKKLGLPTIALSQSADPDSDSDSDDEASLACQFSPIFWRILLADQWQGVRFGSEVSIPGVGSIPPKSVQELFAMRKAVMSLENKTAFLHRRFFTSRLSAGLVPAVAVKGDVIFAILGCDVPFLVRRCETGYRFLGECYVHGFMDGQAMAGGYFEPVLVKLV
ncbi:heterokaryon incompatibility protein-domain-containing protein [Pyrenochaeta sp. MPI-SDFR-AT-0127]|nr:heterokaryon incompatibility protein-domain-containing protein [Pyrenochaeta sp. MPI-SDFR-AT-0127]